MNKKFLVAVIVILIIGVVVILDNNKEKLITDNNSNKYGWGVEFRVQEKVNGEWKVSILTKKEE